MDCGRKRTGAGRGSPPVSRSLRRPRRGRPGLRFQELHHSVDGARELPVRNPHPHRRTGHLKQVAADVRRDHAERRMPAGDIAASVVDGHERITRRHGRIPLREKARERLGGCTHVAHPSGTSRQRGAQHVPGAARAVPFRHGQAQRGGVGGPARAAVRVHHRDGRPRIDPHRGPLGFRVCGELRDIVRRHQPRGRPEPDPAASGGCAAGRGRYSHAARIAAPFAVRPPLGNG